jgi:hypothetical protein
LVAISANIVISAMFSLWFALTRVSVNLIIMFLQFMRWRKPHHKEVKATNRYMLAGIVVFWIGAAIGVGYAMNLTETYYAHWIVPYIDFFGMGAALTANLLVMLGYKEGQFIKIFTNIVVSINSLIYGQWIAIVVAMISSTNATLVWLKWTLDYSDRVGALND